LLEQAASVQRAAKAVGDALFGRAWIALPAVEQAEPPFPLIEEVVGGVADQDHARSVMHVPVVGDVDHELVEHAIFDPAVKHRDEALELDILNREVLDLNLGGIHRDLCPQRGVFRTVNRCGAARAAPTRENLENADRLPNRSVL
jgi:hypothetical protein